MTWRGLIDRIQASLADRREAREFRDLNAASPHDAASLAHEAGTTASELQRVAAGGRQAARLRERMLEAFGIRSEKLSLAEYGALRQTGVTCSLCRSKRRCAIELSRGTARANAAGFCPNVPTFEALTAGPR